MPEFQIGDTVGDYQVIGLLGSGGMGKVFRVRNRLSDRVEAMKVILPGLEKDPALADRFMREIRVHASLDHPNIAALRTALQAGERVLMIMELVEGTSLQERLRAGRLTAEGAVGCVRQVLDALAYAHARGVTHRDVKPPNIILTSAGVAKLTDFGIARSVTDRTLTSTGSAVGSLFYMAPEQIEGAGADARSDIYSLGVTFYEAITGKRPFDGPNDYAIMQAHFAGQADPPSHLNPEIPPALSAIILRAIARQPEQRFQTALEFQSALAPFAGSVVTGNTPIPSRPSAMKLDPAELARLESHLRPVLGPIARHLVTSTARECVAAAELYRRLAEQIPEAAQREAFLRSCESAGTATRTVVTHAPAAPAQAWDPAVIERLKQKLAAYIGPIAPVMVSREMKRAAGLQELYQALAAEIPSERDRQAFLGSLR